ncbi:type II secretion system protein N [Alcaligenes faecalis]|uniref:type II secretion system protein N n=1 Tax=Alcaligenes faecalis TaxID=511 RepID=UPI0005AB193C|nr:type II secretion system protein N [Alcaligenes faecalis]ATI00573.1 general secretion pathway protein GspN [Alcaligenes faecalis]AYZ93360.1 general secretion pathway protein GspN [Alcaligenes faecalis]MCX5596275.1 type II secretion system protein N [Alcaligenes faecalis]QQC34249.1 type II secretion system protein N [Alcaligenes faecalis]CAJ0908104.1 general secretion pathway protein N [Alcaligenes faecalis subsp. faecalis]
MKKLAKITAWALLVLCLLLAAVPFLPARMMLAWQPEQLPLRLETAHGSLASGQGLLVVGSGLLARTVPGPVRWRWRLTPWPQMELSHGWLDQPVRLQASLQGWRISGQSLAAPAALLGRLHPLLQTVQPQGQLQLRWPSQALAAETGPLLELDWRSARSALAAQAELGDYQLAVSRKGQGVQLSLRTLAGDLTLAGQGQWGPQGGQFEGRAQAKQADDQRFKELLEALGPQRQGVTQWRIATTTSKQE